MITDFLKLDIPADDLVTTLRVLRQFKEGESTGEWAHIPFMAWIKLEQFEEFLAHRAEGKPLAADTIRFMEHNNALDSSST